MIASTAIFHYSNSRQSKRNEEIVDVHLPRLCPLNGIFRYRFPSVHNDTSRRHCEAADLFPGRKEAGRSRSLKMKRISKYKLFLAYCSDV